MSELISRDPKVNALLFEEELYQIKAAAVAANSEVSKAPNPEATVSTEFDYLGENNRFFLLLVDEPGQQYLDPVHREALTKILQAKGLDLKDVAILNLQHHAGVDFVQIKSFFSCSKICLFGIDPQKIHMPAFPSNEPGVHADVKVLATFSLQELLQTQHKKVAFWNIMKNF